MHHRSTQWGIVAFLLVSCSAAAGDWPQFRGAKHDYRAEVQALPVTWGPEKNIRWKVEMPGRGWASPVVWGDRIFIATAIQEVEGKETAPPPNYRSGRVGKDSVFRWELHCLDLDTGETVWKQVAFRGNPRVRTHPDNTYASETPVSDGERVYVYFGMIGLFAYDMDGELAWKKDFGGYTMLGDWGTASSPILYEGRLYLQIDNEEDLFLTAIDPKTGDEFWRVERNPGSSWSTPMIWENEARAELVTNGEDLRSYDPETGALHWRLAYPGGRASASPTGIPTALFAGNERRRDGGGVMFAIKAGAQGDITPAAGATASEGVLWSRAEGGPEFASPLVYEGLLYVFGRNRGSVGCFDPATGVETEGQDRLPGARSFWSSPWGYDGKVFCTDEAGKTFVLRGGAARELVETNDLGEGVRVSPALLNGAIIMRGEQHVFCIANE